VDDLSIVASVPLQFPAATHPDTPGTSFPFSGNFFAPAGTFIDYGVNNAGNFLNDSVGLSLTFTTVPEPASWALMLVGFGALGVALRASRRKTVVAA
jgi:PEP-CTERM motif